MKSSKKTNNPRIITAFRCDNGHAFLYPHSDCPVCRCSVRAAECNGAATLVSHTIVRVSPSGRQLRLGLAEIENGAKTLCIIDDTVDTNTAEIDVYLEDGLYRARSRC
jgi:uncharacterized OB-fold protein